MAFRTCECDLYGFNNDIMIAYYLINTKYFKIYKEREYKYKEYKYSDKELVSKALKEIDIKFKSKIGESGKIINKRILQKEG